MPGSTTHYVLGIEAYNDMPQDNLKFITVKYRWPHQLGLQGLDMFFYNLSILYHRDHRSVGSYMHEYHVSYFFHCRFIQFSRVGSRRQRGGGLAYMCGFVCHYIGDSTCHPYVCERIGCDVNYPGPYYHGLYTKLGNDIDALLLQKYKRKRPPQFNQAATICPNGMETQLISQFPSDRINEAFYPLSYKSRYQVMAPMIHRPILALRFGRRTLSDPNDGRKNRIALSEPLFLKNSIVSSKLVTDTVENPAWSLNLHHETWCDPRDKGIASKSSFPDLFRQSLGKLGIVLYTTNSMLETGQPSGLDVFENLLSELGSYPYYSRPPYTDD